MLFKHLATLVTAFAIVTSHATAHMAMLYPWPRGYNSSKGWHKEIHAWIGFSPDRVLPCNGYGPGLVTQLKAGQQVNVRFWGPKLGKNYMNRLPAMPGSKDPQLNQARHGGGRCQFSLSNDGGKTFHLIGEYTHSCPDFYYAWPVKIPDNVPSCNQAGKCLFVWSWTAVNMDQFYQNCADVVIKGKSDGTYPKKGIQIVDVKGYPQKVFATGDGFENKKGRGPNPREVRNNLRGKWN
ncbi:hypothetical protein BGZ93_001474 [Podila epicladia]|nr:hypothetical protein BGZ93_001474 [Podila epicladia]KAG0092819.1 hypothetical protein BGZ92_008530 [Podila epicladia]